LNRHIDNIYSRSCYRDQVKAWDLDELGERSMIPYQVKLSIEDILQHAWTQDIAEKVLCDEPVIHHVEENTRREDGSVGILLLSI
jgi:hypothetical protein